MIAAGPAAAGPWTQPKGEGQIIVKIESLRAQDGFDNDGGRVALLGARQDQLIGIFAEYGVADRLTLQFKGDWQWGEDAVFDYAGRGPAEIGVTWQAWRSDRGAFSLYGGYADAGDGRNAGYAPPGLGRRDWEGRAALGWSFDGLLGLPIGPAQGSFLDLQAARRLRDDLPDETRLDVTMGAHLNADWMMLNQVFAGQGDDMGEVPGSRWLSLETSLVRRQGAWSLQLGWRQALGGRSTPRSAGPVIGLWRRF
ncbi:MULTISPECIES: hypothetical protein [unclassified Brevundimonas]|uniref:hypothetical protein n=1 Tax=unclassified Brevundimonas TaxID=2622653 RepID=UPI001FD816E6|nr:MULTISPECIES: hypothetical protein [unclassified Brevundimonas]